MAAPRNIGLFGGTFDPVHLGHVHLATLAKDALALDEVRFLPCRISPHKAGSLPAGGAHRCEMLRLATAGLPWAVVDDFELHQPEPSYSFQTAEAMVGRFPHDRLFWIMGGDQWEALPRWKHPERLASCVEFIVIARGNRPLPREDHRLHVVPGCHPASASAIRSALPEDGSIHPWLHPDVGQWIKVHGLYRDPATEIR